jgi:hypothetical protein
MKPAYARRLESSLPYVIKESRIGDLQVLRNVTPENISGHNRVFVLKCWKFIIKTLILVLPIKGGMPFSYSTNNGVKI